MNWLQTLTIVLHVLIASAIVGLVLLQRGKGADAGAGFGAGASGTVFGARGSSSFLSRTTAILAALFMVTSLTLAYMGGRKSAGPTSVIDRVQEPAPTPESALPTLPSDQSNQPVEAPSAPAQSSSSPATTDQADKK